MKQPTDFARNKRKEQQNKYEQDRYWNEEKKQQVQNEEEQQQLEEEYTQKKIELKQQFETKLKQIQKKEVTDHNLFLSGHELVLLDLIELGRLAKHHDPNIRGLLC